MNTVNIKFEVHYHDVIHTHGSDQKMNPNWKKGINDPQRSEDARYRIYIDSELLAERVWTWGNNHYIKENLFIEIDKNNEHSISIEPLFCTDYLGISIAIRMKNIHVSKSNIINQSKNNVTFKLA